MVLPSPVIAWHLAASAADGRLSVPIPAAVLAVLCLALLLGLAATLTILLSMRRRAQEALRASEERLRTTLLSMGDGGDRG